MSGVGLDDPFGYRVLADQILQLDPVLSEVDFVAVPENVLFDLLVIDECAVRARKILEEVSLRCLYNFGMVSGDVLIAENDVRVALSSNQHFSGHNRENIFLPVGSDPI